MQQPETFLLLLCLEPQQLNDCNRIELEFDRPRWLRQRFGMIQILQSAAIIWRRRFTIVSRGDEED